MIPASQWLARGDELASRHQLSAMGIESQQMGLAGQGIAKIGDRAQQQKFHDDRMGVQQEQLDLSRRGLEIDAWRAQEENLRRNTLAASSLIESNLRQQEARKRIAAIDSTQNLELKKLAIEEARLKVSLAQAQVDKVKASMEAAKTDRKADRSLLKGREWLDMRSKAGNPYFLEKVGRDLNLVELTDPNDPRRKTVEKLRRNRDLERALDELQDMPKMETDILGDPIMTDQQRIAMDAWRARYGHLGIGEQGEQGGPGQETVEPKAERTADDLQFNTDPAQAMRYEGTINDLLFDKKNEASAKVRREAVVPLVKKYGRKAFYSTVSGWVDHAIAANAKKDPSIMMFLQSNPGNWETYRGQIIRNLLKRLRENEDSKEKFERTLKLVSDKYRKSR